MEYNENIIDLNKHMYSHEKIEQVKKCLVYNESKTFLVVIKWLCLGIEPNKKVSLDSILNSTQVLLCGVWQKQHWVKVASLN